LGAQPDQGARAVGGDRGVSGSARIVLRPIASPLPLGFLALAGGTLLLSGLQLGWLAPAQGRDAR
jgi:hypothetical protein